MKVEYKPLPLSKVRSVVGQRRIKYRKIVWHTAELYIKTFLSLEEYNELTDSIVQYCYVDADCPAYEMVDFALRLNTIAFYAIIELPTDIDELYYIAYESDLYDVVCANANKAQISSIISFVDRYFWNKGR